VGLTLGATVYAQLWSQHAAVLLSSECHIIKLINVFVIIFYSVNAKYIYFIMHFVDTHSGVMVSALVCRSSGPGFSPGRGCCVVFLGKTLYSHRASLHPGV